MAGIGSNPYLSNRHADVLGAVPEDEGSKQRLVDELKNRAKGAFGCKDMQSAELLWGKAIEILATTPGKEEAALFSNRAMVRLNLSNVEGALSDSKKCLELDPKFVKAHHRKAQAMLRMSDFDGAIAAAKSGAELEPANKAWEELITQAEKDKARDAEDKAKLRRDAQDVRVELHNASTARSANPAPKKKQGDEEDTSMRGYKTRADGKKTSYFHTDISDEAKRLIAEQGFGKPQKLETPVDDVAAKGGGSTWNQAGTYEEKGMRKWWDDRLKADLVGISFTIPGGAGAGNNIVTTAIEKIEGEASISVSRGKRRHILELAFHVGFQVEIDGAKGSGNLCFSDLNTMGDDPEVNMEIDKDTSPSIREVFNAFVKVGGQGLQPAVLSKLKELVAEYNKC